jgi:hypothetical protein
VVLGGAAVEDGDDLEAYGGGRIDVAAADLVVVGEAAGLDEVGEEGEGVVDVVDLVEGALVVVVA